MTLTLLSPLFPATLTHGSPGPGQATMAVAPLSGHAAVSVAGGCFFSYLHVSRDDATGFPRSGYMAVDTTPTRPTLLILLWTWPFHIPVALSRCSEMVPGMADCRITADRKVYPQADAVIVHHRDIMYNPSAPAPTLPEAAGSPKHCWHLQALDGYFNLTMSYRSDSDIFTPYGWLEPRSGQPAHPPLNLSAKTELVAWAVSNWKPDSARVRYYQSLQAHLKVDVYGKSHKPLPRGTMMETLSRYKFYLAFENSLHPDYITEKVWRNALEAWAVPVVLGPSRSNYERFLPPDAFIYVDDFQSPKDLARYLQELDKDHVRYLSYFRWQETLRPRFSSWALDFCKACWKLQEESRYQTVCSVWFT
uniref:Fucosyltransferase n=1 Tax=Macaca nemestrina TaxID=9545 RepID=A0A2K6ATB2_MACNE